MVIFNIYGVQMAVTPIRLTRVTFFLCVCVCVLHVVSCQMFTFVRKFIISRSVFNLQSGHQYTVEMAMFNVKRAITPEVWKIRVMIRVMYVIS